MLIFAKLSLKFVRSVWKWGEGSMPKRAVGSLGIAGAAALLLLMWAPQVDLSRLATGQSPTLAAGSTRYRPIQPGERLNVGDAFRQQVVIAQPQAQQPAPHAGRPTGGARQAGPALQLHAANSALRRRRRRHQQRRHDKPRLARQQSVRRQQRRHACSYAAAPWRHACEQPADAASRPPADAGAAGAADVRACLHSGRRFNPGAVAASFLAVVFRSECCRDHQRHRRCQALRTHRPVRERHVADQHLAVDRQQHHVQDRGDVLLVLL